MTRDPHESFWTYKAPAPPADAPCGMPRDQWEQLSPGMRREIQRDWDRRQAKAQGAEQ